MSPEEQELLKKTARLAEENNAILRKMQRVSRWSIILKVAYWILIIALTVAAFYGFQAYVGSLRDALGTAGGGGSPLNNLLNNISGQ